MRRAARSGWWGVLVTAVVAAEGCGAAKQPADVDVAVPERGELVDAGTDAPDAPAAPDASVDASSVTAVGPTVVSSLSLAADYTTPADGPIGADGQNDGMFEATVTGPAVGLALISTDAAGNPSGNQQWDTWVANDAIPAVGTIFTVGASTWQLAVVENGTILNDAAGRLTLTPGPHVVRLAGSSAGTFVTGNHFRLVAQAPDGSLVQGPVIDF